MFFIVLEDVETIIYRSKGPEKGSHIGVTIKAGEVIYRPKNDREWATYRYFLNEAEYQAYYSVPRKRKTKRVYRLYKVSLEELGRRCRPLTIHDKAWVELMDARKARIKKKHPKASDKQLYWWAMRSMQQNFYAMQGADVRTEDDE